jgi:hypothetical protein
MLTVSTLIHDLYSDLTWTEVGDIIFFAATDSKVSDGSVLGKLARFIYGRE